MRRAGKIYRVEQSARRGKEATRLMKRRRPGMATYEKKGLLSDDQYDQDAGTLHTDPQTDSEADEEVKHEDRQLLKETAENEALIASSRRFGEAVDLKSRRREERRRRNSNKKKRNAGTEEGFRDASSQSSSEFEDDEEQKAKYRAPAKKRGIFAIFLIILGLFIAFAFLAFRASKKRAFRLTPSQDTRFSNGTHSFKPTTILISLDGFRADFLNRGLTPAMNAFIASGVSPRYMTPSFPSVTFPNHFTLVTGLYPESHGIVGNQFWDPKLAEEFYYTDTIVSMQPKWWTAEPLWVTAEHQFVRTAVHMWPGSEAHIPDREPSYVDKYNETETLTRKVDRLLGWLDLPGDDDEQEGDKRPQLLLSYVPNVDADGHMYGPNSTEIRGTIADVDSMLTILVEGLLQRNLTEIVNLVIVSDHGMATTSTARLIQLDDLIDMSLVDHIDGWPLRGLRLKYPQRDVPVLHEQLLKVAEETGAFDVYTLDTMPTRYHFTNNDRIAPLWVVPKTGWAVVERTDFDVADALARNQVYAPMGLHGYDHEHPLMRAIFVARGPAFPHPPNSRVAPFQNIEVYNIICDSLGIKSHPNNGTLHLPLKIEGLHSDPDAPALDTPHDEEQNEPIAPAGTTPNNTQDEAKSGHETNKSSWWDYLHDQLQKAKDWAKQFVDSIEDNKPDASDKGG